MNLLEQYGTESYENEVERVRIAILKLSEGSLEELARVVVQAKQDYRDVLAWAEYPEALRKPTWDLPPAERTRIQHADRDQYLTWLKVHTDET